MARHIQFSLKTAAFAFFALGLVLALTDRHGWAGGCFAIAITVIASGVWAWKKNARDGLAMIATLLAAQPAVMAMVLCAHPWLRDKRLYGSIVTALEVSTLFASGPLGLVISFCSDAFNDRPRWLDVHLLLIAIVSVIQWRCVYYLGLKLLQRHKTNPRTPMIVFGLAVLALFGGAFFFNIALIAVRHS